MRRRLSHALVSSSLSFVAVVALAACGGPAHEPQGPIMDPVPEPTASEPAPPEATSSEAADGPAQPTAAPADERTPMEALARDMIKNGRRIGWSDSKRSIAYGEYWTEPSGRGFHVMFVGEDGKADQHEVCKAGECDEVLDERVVTEVPKIAQKLEAGGYQPVSSAGWAVDQPELALRGTDLKLSFAKGRLSLVDGKKVHPLGSAPPKSAPVAIFLVKDSKVVVVDYRLDAPAKSDQGFEVLHQLKLYKLP